MSFLSSSTFAISITTQRSLDKVSRHLYICLVALHRNVCKTGDASKSRLLFYQHQVFAASRLHRKLMRLGSRNPDPRLVEAIALFVYSQLQDSVYGPWRIHLEGAKALLQCWGGHEALVGKRYFACYVLVIADIYGTTTSPKRLLAGDTVSQHRAYERLLDRLEIDT